MILNVFKGCLIGMALIVPGLSASVFAIIVGLYERGLSAVADFRKAPVRHGLFLLPIAIGAGVGVLVAAQVVLAVVGRFPGPAYFFFCGIIIGSSRLVFAKAKPIKPVYFIAAAVAFFLVMFMANLNNGERDQLILSEIGGVGDFFTLALAGLISASMVAIPGLSGSVLVIILGHFGTIYNAIGEVFALMRHLVGLDFPAAWDSFATVALLIPFALGSFVGFVSVAKLMSHVIAKAGRLLYHGVMGVLLGTVVILVQMGVAGQDVHWPASIATLIAGITCGMLLRERS